MTATSDVRIESWSGAQLAERVDEAMRIYSRAMHYPAYTGTQRAVTTRRHTVHAGFACRVALDSKGAMVGFGYGYTTKPGQWWHDLVRRALSPELLGWLDDAFELSEIHVLPRHQGSGVGRELLTGMASELTNRAVLLSTPDSDTRAFRLYRHLGFVDLARNYLFPGDARPFAVLGAELPLSHAG